MSLIFLDWRLSNDRVIKCIRSLLFSHFIWFKKRLYTVSVYLLFEVVLYGSSSSIYIFVEVRHPNHNQFILSSSGKIITFLIEFNSFNFTLMSKHSPSKSSLLQIPYFNFTIVWNWWHMISMWMESYPVYGLVMCIIMLNQFTKSCIP